MTGEMSTPAKSGNNFLIGLQKWFSDFIQKITNHINKATLCVNDPKSYEPT